MQKLIRLRSGRSAGADPFRPVLGQGDSRSDVSKVLQGRVPFFEKDLAFSIHRALGRGVNQASPPREAWIGPELHGVRSCGVDGGRARRHCLNQLLGQRRLVSLKCGKKGKKITCDLVGDFFLWKETPGLDVAVPGGVSEIGRADIGAYAPPPDDLCVVTFHKAACKPSGFAGQEFSQYWDTDSNALVEAAI